jgi:hypothetical protein
LNKVLCHHGLFIVATLRVAVYGVVAKKNEPRPGRATRRAHKNAAAIYPNEAGAPEIGIIRNCELLTPQAEDLNAWYLKTGLIATAI